MILMPTLKCPKCNKTIKKAWVRCPNCQEFLKKKCPECQKEIEIKWDVCPYCGKEINKKEEITISAKTDVKQKNKKNTIVAVFGIILIIAIITLAFSHNSPSKTDGTEGTAEKYLEKLKNIETTNTNNVYQDEDSKSIISLAMDTLEKSRQSFEQIKVQQYSKYTLLAMYENKIDLENCRQDMSSADYSSFKGALGGMEIDIAQLTGVIHGYNRAIEYFDEAEEMNISPEYREYLTKYKEAIIKEIDGITQYQVAMRNKKTLLSFKAKYLEYIYLIDEADKFYQTLLIHHETVSKKQAEEYNNILHQANSKLSSAYSVFSSAYYVSQSPVGSAPTMSDYFFFRYNKYEDKPDIKYPVNGPRRTESGLNKLLLKWENTNVTQYMNLSEKYLNEAKTLFKEAEKIKPK